MRALDDIVIGFLIFYAIDRVINLFSKNIVQPWANETARGNKDVSENCKLVTELVCLIIMAVLIFKFRKTLQRLDNS
jgi:large-conductance mechanosensitive channel